MLSFVLGRSRYLNSINLRKRCQREIASQGPLFVTRMESSWFLGTFVVHQYPRIDIPTKLVAKM